MTDVAEERFSNISNYMEKYIENNDFGERRTSK
jgi:hypothetical protein